MSIAALQKDFERLAKKQRTARCSRNEKLDSLLQELERAKEEIEAQDEIMDEDGTKGDAQDGAAGSVQAVVEQLESSVKAANIGETLAAENKELCYLITKFGKAVDRQMPPDLERAIKPVPIDSKLLNQVIVEHFLRSGRIDLAKHLATEAEVDLPEEKVAPYAALVSILDAIKSRELGQAREWAAQYAGPLAHRNSPLPFRLARMHFLQLVEGGKVEEAIAFARASFPKFAAQHLLEVQKLMGTLVYAKRLPGSPYETLFEPEAWESVGRLFRRESCEVLGLAHDLPLAVSVHAGVRALPSLLKFATVMHAKMGDWHARGGSTSLAVEVELGQECRFHSVFVCPVSREQACKENRPMMMQCGHVLCELSLRKLSRGGGRESRFKCPYCPAEVSLATSIRLYL